MKAYGVSDNDDNVLWLRTGKTSKGKVAKHGNDIRAYIRYSKKKQQLRRSMKKSERQQVKNKIILELY